MTDEPDLYQLDIEGCLSGAIGDAGLDDAELTPLLTLARAALDRIGRSCGEGRLPALSLVRQDDDLDRIEALAERWRGTIRDLVVIGTGGSSLGAQTLLALDGSEGRTPRVRFLDNADPDTCDCLWAAIDWTETHVLAISKSGNTVETVAQTLFALDRAIERLGATGAARHFTIVTQPGPSPLRSIAEEYGMDILPHDPDIGGRFSVFSLVGLLPAGVGGIDVRAVRRGAASALNHALAVGDRGDGHVTTPGLSAAVTVALARLRGISQSVLFGYGDRLASFGEWYRQLVAESLGKGGQGITPIFARGATDQHSQLQLYLDGPRDKMITVLEALQTSDGEARTLTAELAQRFGVDYLAGHSLDDVFHAEARATYGTLRANKRPVARITIDRIDEARIGALMMHAMLEVIVAGRSDGRQRLRSAGGRAGQDSDPSLSGR